MADMKWLLAVLVYTGLVFTCSGQQMTMRQDICSYQFSSGSMSEIEVGITDVTQLRKDGACSCELTSSSNTTEYINFDINLVMANFNAEESTNDCDNPLMFVDMPSVNFEGETYEGGDYYICPAQSGSVNGTHRSLVTLEPDKSLSFLVTNPKEQQLTSSVKIFAEGEYLSIKCRQEDMWKWEENQNCPCSMKTPGRTGETVPGDNMEKSDKTKEILLGVLIPVVLIALIVVAVLLYRYMKKKRRDQPSSIEKKAATQENRAYEGSQAEVEQGRHPVNVTPDPSLNLNPAKPNGRRGSHDSGFPSDQSTNRYANHPASQMQPYTQSQSMENVNQMPTNYPALAGQGSQSSLNNPALMNPAQVDAFYGRGQHQQPAPMHRTPQQYPAPHHQQPGPYQPGPHPSSRSGSINALNVDEDGRMGGQSHTHTEI